MYFSVLPVLLLFTSAVRALPVTVHHGYMDFDGVQLPFDKLGGSTYASYFTIFDELEPLEAKHGWRGSQEYNGWHLTKVEGVEAALKIISEGKTVVKVVVPHAGVRRVMAGMIHMHPESFSYWGWDIVSETDIAFVLEIKPGGEKLIKQCLGEHTANTNHVHEDLTGAVANMSLNPSHGAQHSG